MRNQKENIILSAARELFIKYGIRRVSIEEICQTALVSKGTFYKYFRNKNQLLRILLRDIVDEGYQLLDGIFNQTGSFPEKIEKYLLLRMKRSEEFGSLFIDEIINPDSELKSFAVELREEGYGKIVEILKRGQRENAIRQDLSADFFQIILENLMHFFNSEALKKIMPDSRTRLIEVTKLMFYGITRRKI